MSELLCNLLGLYILILFGRAILSFFPVSSEGFMATLSSLLFRATEPLLAPARRVIPAVGMFDLSFLVVMLGVQLLRGVVCRGAL